MGNLRFEFIDNNAPISRSVRKRIRSHAATGKNAGKVISRPSRKKALEHRFLQISPTSTPSAYSASATTLNDTSSSHASNENGELDDDPARMGELEVVEIDRPFGHELCFPVEVDLKSRILARSGKRLLQ
jgi:hypothetical protein